MEILIWIENQSSFIQSLIASTLFGATIWMLRTILRLSARTGAATLKQFEKQSLIKHWLYRYYVNSDDVRLRNEGFHTVVLFSIKWAMRGILILVFFLCIDSILNKNWLWVVCSWLVFNSFFEAYQWVKDTSDHKYIVKIDKKILEEFVSELPEHQAKVFVETDNGS